MYSFSVLYLPHLFLFNLFLPHFLLRLNRITPSLLSFISLHPLFHPFPYSLHTLPLPPPFSLSLFIPSPLLSRRCETQHRVLCARSALWSSKPMRDHKPYLASMYPRQSQNQCTLYKAKCAERDNVCIVCPRKLHLSSSLSVSQDIGISEQTNSWRKPS